MITQEYLKKNLHYNPDTGVFTRTRSGTRSDLVGKSTGCTSPSGYVFIHIAGRQHRAHRLAFLYMTGSIPEFCDHKNRIRSDNRWQNLRPATRKENLRNTSISSRNKSGYKGVSWYRKGRKWHSQISCHGKNTHIGYFDCKYHAFCEYVLKSREMFGEFSSV